MPNQITPDIITDFQQRLENHPIYSAVVTIEDLRCFMQHHIYPVWDFMSLIKYLQSVIAPASFPWVPLGDASVRRFINELVLEEETDTTIDEKNFSSHYELYLTAMNEIGADTSAAVNFVAQVSQQGIRQALSSDSIPAASRDFTRTTFQFIEENSPHKVAAALALGREHIIPGMFRSILKRIGVTEKGAPIFHYYLNRHVHLDEDFHAPLSLRLLNNLCQDDEVKINEAIEAANTAVTARLNFWDGVLTSIQGHNKTSA